MRFGRLITLSRNLGRVRRVPAIGTVALLLTSLHAGGAAPAVLTPPKGYVCYRARRPVVIDGRLDDPAWKDALWTDPFVDIEGDSRPKPRYRTRCKMLWDDAYFYIAAELEEPHVWGTLTQRDSVICHDNDFEVFIDPDGDNHEYYELEINTLNTVWDLFLPKPYRDGGQARNEWDIAGLKTAVCVDGTLNDPSDVDRGWSVEMALPWKALAEYAHRPAPPRNGDQWRVNFSRVEWQHEVVEGRYRKVAGTREDNWVWSPQGAIDMHRPERWGYVQFSTARPGRDRFRPDPTLPARDLLHQVYYAQRTYRQQHGRYTATFDELGLKDLAHASLAGPLRLEFTPEGYTATARLKVEKGAGRTLHLRSDSRIWEE
jgi:hypothetical protein